MPSITGTHLSIVAFFTKPFESAYKNLPDELIEKYGLEVLDLFRSSLKDIR